MSSTDNAIVRYNGTTGAMVQNSTVTVADTTGAISFLAATGANITWATDGGGTIGAVGANRPNIIYSKASILSPVFSTDAANPASAGTIRLSNNVTNGAIAWRNGANGADKKLYTNNIDLLVYESSILSDGSTLTASRVMVTNGATAAPTTATTTTTEINFVAGVTSAIQTQLNAKATTASVALKANIASPTFTGTVNTAGWSIYKDGTDPQLLGFNTLGGGTSYILQENDDGEMVFAAGPDIAGAGGPRNIHLYGATHATLANIIQVSRGSTVDFSINNSGVTSFLGGTASSNTTTGQIVVTGGIGASGAVNAGGNLTTNANLIATAGTFTGLLTVSQGVTPGEVRFLEGSGGGTNYIGFKAPAAVTTNKVYELPTADGAAGEVLTTNGSGVLSFSVNGTPSIYAARYTTTTQTVPAAAATIIDFETVVFDSDSEVTTGASWKYTATVTGKFEISAFVSFTNASFAAGQESYLAIYKNNAFYSFIDHKIYNGAASTSIMSLNGTALVNLSATDYADVRLYQNTGADVDLDATYVSSISIHRAGA